MKSEVGIVRGGCSRESILSRMPLEGMEVGSGSTQLVRAGAVEVGRGGGAAWWFSRAGGSRCGKRFRTIRVSNLYAVEVVFRRATETGASFKGLRGRLWLCCRGEVLEEWAV